MATTIMNVKPVYGSDCMKSCRTTKDHSQVAAFIFCKLQLLFRLQNWYIVFPSLHREKCETMSYAALW